jgi:hypothetical protein
LAEKISEFAVNRLGSLGPRDIGAMGRPRRIKSEDHYEAARARAYKTARWIMTGKGEPAKEHVELLLEGTWRASVRNFRKQ